MSSIFVYSSKELFLMTPQFLLISRAGFITHRFPLEKITHLSIKDDFFVIETTIYGRIFSDESKEEDESDDESDTNSEYTNVVRRDLSDFSDQLLLRNFIEEVNVHCGGREFRKSKRDLSKFTSRWRAVVSAISFVLIFPFQTYHFITFPLYLILTVLVVTLFRDNVMGPCLFLPAAARSWIKAEIDSFRETKETFLIRNPSSAAVISFKTSDGFLLDGVRWINPYTPTKKWLLWLNPNAAGYEDHLVFLHKYATEARTNFFAFNYRGVGESEGVPRTATDLVNDGEAAMQYLLGLGVETKNILIHGHSMGGGVGVIIRSRFPDGPIVSDRSFASLGVVAVGICREAPALRFLVGGLLGLWLGFFVGLFRPTLMSLGMFSFGGFFAGAATFAVLPSLSCFAIWHLVDALGWNMNPMAAWPLITGDKALVAHPMDGIINFADMSLFRAILEEEKNAVRIQLGMKDSRINAAHQLYHCYSLDALPQEWAQLTSFARKSLRID